VIISENNKFHILVTNDDGVYAPGLLTLAHAMSKIGKVSVLAPERNWSVTGHVRTLDRPLRVRQVELAEGCVSVTPIHLDMTDNSQIKELENWEWGNKEKEVILETPQLFLQGIYF
jgi:broad specificity polyphosphatase/5'/3'-nucleotidase SurE